MAIIQGLEEQKKALARVKTNLKEIRDINESVQNLKSFIGEAKHQEYKLECDFSFEDDSFKRIKVPLVLSDTDFIYNSIKAHKDAIVAAIREDLTKNNILLDPQEEALLAD